MPTGVVRSLPSVSVCVCIYVCSHFTDKMVEDIVTNPGSYRLLHSDPYVSIKFEDQMSKVKVTG